MSSVGQLKFQRLSAAGGKLQLVANWNGDPCVIVYYNRRPQPLSLDEAKDLAVKLAKAIELAEEGLKREKI